MNLISALFLGVLQGLTEFLPVSSSGHLVLVQSLLPGFSQPGVLFDVLLHFGTLLAIVFFFRSEIMKLNSKYLYFLILGTIPAVIVGSVIEANDVFYRVITANETPSISGLSAGT